MRTVLERRSGRSGPLTTGLACLAMVQVGAIVVWTSRPGSPPSVRPPDLSVGEVIPDIRGRGSLAEIASIPLRRSDARWTVLLAFSPTCAWCDSVAPLWKRWTEEPRPRVRVVAVASGDPSAAARYGRSHGWRLGALIVVDSALTGLLGRQLTRKTPWLFLFDSKGILRHSGHGNEVQAVDSLVGVLP